MFQQVSFLESRSLFVEIRSLFVKIGLFSYLPAHPASAACHSTPAVPRICSVRVLDDLCVRVCICVCVRVCEIVCVCVMGRLCAMSDA